MTPTIDTINLTGFYLTMAGSMVEYSVDANETKQRKGARMSNPKDDGAFLIKTMGFDGAENEARKRYRDAVDDDPNDTYAHWCGAVVAYIEGYRDGVLAVENCSLTLPYFYKGWTLSYTKEEPGAYYHGERHGVTMSACDLDKLKQMIDLRAEGRL